MNKVFSVTISVLFVLLFTFSNLLAQDKQKIIDLDKLPPLSVQDSLGLINLPELTISDCILGPTANLPSVVDNSPLIYWRPVFAQVQYECGQASGIGSCCQGASGYQTRYAWHRRLCLDGRY